MNSENTQNQKENTPNSGQTTPGGIGQRFEIAVLPLQNTTLFPDTVVPLNVGRKRSIQAVETALATEEKLIACFTTKVENVTGDDVKPAELYDVGTLVNIKRMM